MQPPRPQPTCVGRGLCPQSLLRLAPLQQTLGKPRWKRCLKGLRETVRELRVTSVQCDPFVQMRKSISLANCAAVCKEVALTQIQISQHHPVERSPLGLPSTHPVVLWEPLLSLRWYRAQITAFLQLPSYMRISPTPPGPSVAKWA